MARQDTYGSPTLAASLCLQSKLPLQVRRLSVSTPPGEIGSYCGRASAWFVELSSMWRRLVPNLPGDVVYQALTLDLSPKPSLSPLASCTLGVCSGLANNGEVL